MPEVRRRLPRGVAVVTPPASVDEQAAAVDSLMETITESVRYALWSHATRRESRYGENMAWDVDVHTPESCSRCAFETALDALAARAREVVSLREALRRSNNIEMSAYVLLLEVEALGLTLNGMEALHDELEAVGATFPVRAVLPGGLEDTGEA